MFSNFITVLSAGPAVSLYGSPIMSPTTATRLDYTIASMQTAAENVASARSRIEDTDFASETANLTKNQILQQAGTAMLAQANQVPQNVLSLLR